MVTRQTRQKRSHVPYHVSRNKVAALNVIYPKFEERTQLRQGMMESFSYFYLLAVYHLGEQISLDNSLF